MARRSKKAVEETPKPEPKKARKPRKVTKKTDSIVRTLVNPETGEIVEMTAYDQYPEAFRYMAQVMYVSGVASIHQIARKLNIPENTIRTWQNRDGWVAKQREVKRLASREAVRVARTSMSNYIKDMDRGLNSMMEVLNERWTAIKNDPEGKKINDEVTVVKAVLEVWKAKRDIIRMLTYGIQGKAFTPHPTNFVMDGTLEPVVTPSLTSNSAEEVLEMIPPYLKNAAHFVMEMDMDLDSMDPVVLDALAKHIDSLDDDDVIDADDDDDIML